MNFPPKLLKCPELLEKLERNGVKIDELENVWVSPKTTIGRGTVIHPNCYLIGEANSSIGEDCEIGPNAFLRDWFVLGNNVKIGFNAEVVRSSIGDGTKAAHRCHIGDAMIGKRCNIAAGVDFCNFDGKQKNVTIVEDDVFIGDGTKLIPSAKGSLNLGRCCLIGAGSIVKRSVLPGIVVVGLGRVLSKMKVIKTADDKWDIIYL